LLELQVVAWITFRARWLAALWAVLVLLLTLMPGDDVPRWEWARVVQLDKWVHAGLFGVQAVLLGWAGQQVRKWPRVWLSAACGMLASVAYGAAIEGMQTLLDWGRQGELADLLADAAGALLGFAWLLRRGGA
jgi:VanZ family protein